MTALPTLPRAAGVRVRASAVDELRLTPPAVAGDGSLPLSSFQVARVVAGRLTETGSGPVAGAAEGTRGPSAVPASAAELAAMGLLDEILRMVIVRYHEEVRSDALETALLEIRSALGEETLHRSLGWVRDEFERPLAEARPLPAVVTLEDLLHVWLANVNPALAPYRMLVDDTDLTSATAYESVVRGLDAAFRRLPPFGPDGQSLVELLRAPALASPDSIAGQLRFIRERWGTLVGDVLDRLLIHLDVLVEEELATWRRFHPFGGGTGDSAAALGAALTGLDAEPERFSADSAWMPRVVLLAKSTYVWLDQLSRRHARDIRRLDDIPDEELDRIASWGVTGLWLIGLWERSRASERIKRMRGNPEAVASAYSLDDYRIADDLGGEAAYASLRERAWQRGIRLASDMVPNHMGIDSRWVIEHPERFLQLGDPPYPGYRFGGPDLSDDPRVGIFLEEHYWDNTDAAVVFRREDRGSGESRYIYHGNDGTSFPWNDTAQLDYLEPQVREAVIQTILDVARRFPIIRFDAAMTLAKKHIERLWYPEPGSGGAIPSRAEHAISKAAFDAAMPVEFWREVVDRVAAEVPDTLLLAEAFWLMEGYFVRTLGMHRVYNSAFMHMLRDEDNAGYRRVMKDTLEFDPEILKRYVNFMNNPDEKTAVEQFGRGDKYFGVATVLATLPGLPMIGHGQVEGFAEKYGMEYRRAYHDEQPDTGLVAYHERAIFPLLHRRAQFADVGDFLLYDVVADDGSVSEDVFAYSNVGPGGERSLVVYHNRFGSAHGWVRDSAAYSVPDGAGGRRLVRRTLGEGWRLPDEPGTFVAYRDQAGGLEYLQRSADVRERGLRVELEAYQRLVLLDVRELRDGTAGLWSRLADRLAGGGVPSLEDALRELAFEPVYAPLGSLLGATLAELIARGSAVDAVRLESALGRVADALREVAGVSGEPAEYVSVAAARVGALTRLITGHREAAVGHRPAAGATSGSTPAPKPTDAAAAIAHAPAQVAPSEAVDPAFGDPGHRAVLVGWAALEPLGRLAPGTLAGATSRAWFDELRLAPVIAGAFRYAGLDEAGAWAAADRIRSLLAVPRPSNVDGRSATERSRHLVEAWLAHPDVRPLMRVNTWEGVDWFGRDEWRELLDWVLLLDILDAESAGSGKAAPTRERAVAESSAVVERLLEAGESSGYRLDRLRELTIGGSAAARARSSGRATGSPKRSTRRGR